VGNVNALRIQKAYEGQGYISALMREMEAYARQSGYTSVTIGVEAKETRNLAIYLHWGYTRFICSEMDDGELVLYYAKDLG
jgi:GNAT superfamily N-acetyltransferase